MNGRMIGPGGVVKEVKAGFSWTTLFFNFWVPVFRSDWKWAIIIFFACFFTFGIAWFVWPFVYNKIYIKGLLEQGYTPEGDSFANYLRTKGIMV